MAKAKAKAKKKKHPQMGHNSDQQAIDAELAKVAKAQRSLDKEKAEIKKVWRDSEKNLTERLEKIGFTRDQFKAPYKRFCEIADCKNDEDVRTVQENHRIFLAKQRQMFDALGHGQSIDWIDLIQDADEIVRAREEAEREAAEKAADSADEPEETVAVH